MSYRLIDANALNGVISNDDYEKVLNAPCIFADLPNGLDGEHYNLQEPQTGHWIDDTDKRAWKCSECGWWYRDWKRHNFCSYCGARMDQEPYDVSDINDGKMSENPIDSKDVIWYSKRNYSEIVVEPQESEG